MNQPPPKRPDPITPLVRPKPPERIGEPPTPAIITELPAKDPALAEAGRKMQHEIDTATGPKPTLKERTMSAILNTIWHFVRTWLYAKPVYKSVTLPDGTTVPARDEAGNKIVNVPLTVLGRMVQVLTVLGLLSPIVAGKPISEWIPLLTDIVRAITGG